MTGMRVRHITKTVRASITGTAVFPMRYPTALNQTAAFYRVMPGNKT